MNIIEYDSVMQYIQDMKTIYPVAEGRVTLLNLKKSDNSVSGRAPKSIVFVSIIIFALIAVSII